MGSSLSAAQLADESLLLGPEGFDLESLALVELAVIVEEDFGVKIPDDGIERMGSMSRPEFCSFVSDLADARE